MLEADLPGRRCSSGASQAPQLSAKGQRVAWRWAGDALKCFSEPSSVSFRRCKQFGTAACPTQSQLMDTALTLLRQWEPSSLAQAADSRCAARADHQAVWQPSFAGMLGEEQQQSVERAFSITTHQLDLARQQGHQLQVCPGSSAR